LPLAGGIGLMAGGASELALLRREMLRVVRGVIECDSRPSHIWPLAEIGMASREAVVLLAMARLTGVVTHRCKVVIPPLMLAVARRACDGLARIAQAIIPTSRGVFPRDLNGRDRFQGHAMRGKGEITINRLLVTGHAQHGLRRSRGLRTCGMIPPLAKRQLRRGVALGATLRCILAFE
jgi:hypothetical protein